MRCIGVALLLGLSMVSGEQRGYYSWSWGSGSTGPSNATLGVAFTGWVSVQQAIDDYSFDSESCCPALAGVGMLSLGGGNANGRFTVNALTDDISKNMAAIAAAGYGGVCFDIEEAAGSSADLIPAFTAAFAAAKAENLFVQVTSSHSAPYLTDSAEVAVDLIKLFCSDSNVDEISPQLYSSGTETEPDFGETSSCVEAGCTWELYQGCTANFVPSLVDETHLAATSDYFSTNYGIDVAGFYQWAQQ